MSLSAPHRSSYSSFWKSAEQDGHWARRSRVYEERNGVSGGYVHAVRAGVPVAVERDAGGISVVTSKISCAQRATSFLPLHSSKSWRSSTKSRVKPQSQRIHVIDRYSQNLLYCIRIWWHLRTLQNYSSNIVILLE
jgi:hypothetical protein